MRKILEIIVHCTATFADQRVTVADITRWHKQRGWKTIGYHYVLDQAGNIFEGRPIEQPGAHCLNHNQNSIGIAYCGGLNPHGQPADTRTPEQKVALLELLKRLKQSYPEAVIHGHRDFAKKACPCFDATKEYANL
ncbi:MAG: N-acetylmuramoyl-L-alanine amidase [Paludibacteraceae bacterium]|nr:N-acetylmuramoyl-L-alanine amidase [Paludibacteraceae bacterium]